MKFKKDSLLELYELDKDEKTEDGLIVVNSGKWINDGKYDLCETIFKFEDKFYMIRDSRTGSYHTDYYYGSSDWDEEVECNEVEPHEIKKIVWRVKK